jgi:hypothetical protein
MPKDAAYNAVLERAKIHLIGAWDAFCEDPMISWREIPGNASKARTRMWVDALKETLAHHEEIERRL